MANITANKTLLSSFRHLFIIQKILPGVPGYHPLFQKLSTLTRH